MQLTQISYWLLEKSIVTVCLLNLFASLPDSRAILGFFFLLVGFFASLGNLRIGLIILFSIIPWLAGFQSQLGVWFTFFQNTAPNFHYLNFVIGFIFGQKIRRLNLEERAKKERELLIFESIIFVYLTYIALSGFIGITRNFSNSASYFSVRGLLFNVVNYTSITFLDDFKPLHDFFVLAVASLFSLFLYRLKLDISSFKKIVLNPFLYSSTAVAFFGIIQKFLGIGYSRDPIERGVNSFFPDLHSFAGFLLIPIFSSLWLIQFKEVKSFWQTFGHALCLLVCVICLFLTGSKATVLLLVLFILTIFFLSLRKSASLQLPWKLKIILLFLMFLGVFSVVKFGVGGSRIEDYVVRLSELKFDSFNALMSYRPEIWLASFKMYLNFPVLGLGQGLQFRYSALHEFAGSNYLTSVNGENAHNYFIQRLVENGAIGFFIFIAILIIGFFNKQKEFRYFCVYLIAAVFIGNFYAHALLIPEIFFILFCFIAFAAPRATLVEAANYLETKISNPLVRKIFLFGCSAVLVVFALREVHKGQATWPFRWGSGCYQVTERELNRSAGQLGFEVPPSSKTVALEIVADYGDLGRRPVQVSVFQVNGEQQINAFDSRIVNQDAQQFEFAVPVPAASKSQNLKFLVLASHCFVPKNFGLTTNSGRSGIRLLRVTAKD